MRVGELISMARAVKRWSLRDLERETGISNAVISQIETGHVKDSSFTNIVRLCEALDLPLDRVAALVALKPLKEVLRHGSQFECETCRDDPMTCASIPGLRHCEKAQREHDASEHSPHVLTPVSDAGAASTPSQQPRG